MREGTGEDEKGDDISHGEKGDKREIWHGGKRRMRFHQNLSKNVRLLIEMKRRD